MFSNNNLKISGPTLTIQTGTTNKIFVSDNYVQFPDYNSPLLVSGKPLFYNNVGIGTSSPHANTKLDVAGRIRATEVVVSVNAGSGTVWPDYVFKSDYKLKKLDDVEFFIKKNGHLPSVPSAKEIEANGVNLGAMQATLLEKVEELTLHMIEQNKAINTLKAENARLASLVERN
jgi:hypothetical protein